MKVVILDDYMENPGDLSWNGLEKLGKLTVYDCAADSMEIVERIRDAQVVYANKTPITKKTIESYRNLKYIGVLAAGYNVVDMGAAKEVGMIVTSISAYKSDAVSQFAIALLLESCHHISEYAECVKNGDWVNNSDWCFWGHPLAELAGKIMGIIGLGRIGQGTGRITQTLGVKALVRDTRRDKSLESVTRRYVEMDELLAASDVISLRCPLPPETRGVINRESTARMKGGVMVMNNSREQLIVEEDLRDALNSGKVAGAVVDVVSTESIRADNPLLTASNCIITPHVSRTSRESRQRLTNITIDNLKAHINGKSADVINE